MVRADNHEGAIYASCSDLDAARVANFVNARQTVNYAVIPVKRNDAQWIVAGPQSGDYVSRLDTFESRNSADAQAEKWAQETGENFRVVRAKNALGESSGLMPK